MGKYAKLRGKLPAFEAPPDWKAKVDAAAQEILGTGADQAPHANISWLAVEFVKRKRKKERLEEKVKALNVELEACSQLLVARLEGEDIQNVALRGGVTVFLADDPYPTVEDRQQLFDYIKRTHQTQLLSVHYQTLRGLVGERLTRGEDPPPGVKVYLKTQARCRGLRNGEADE